MKLYKFRTLQNIKDYERVIDIINNGFYCNDFLNFNDMNEGVYTVNEQNNHITLSDKQRYKICSFSGEKALNSELMWGHYTNAGKGVLIEIDIFEQYNSDIKKIIYRKNKNLNTLDKILMHKTKEWKYEDEYRYLSTNSLLDNKVKIGKIIKIYFGTPYKILLNYEEIKGQNKYLQDYLDFKQNLELFCTKQNIQFEDFKFDITY